MKSLSSTQKFLKKMGISTILLTFVIASFPLTSFAAGPSVDIQANGSDGPITLNAGDTYTYSWTSSLVTSCQITSPVNSGIPLSGTSATIGAGNPFYPASGSSITLTITCDDGVTTATDSVTINLSATPPPTPPASTTPTVDVKANGSDGPITINPGDTYVYTWVSANATSCQITSPVNSGIPLSGTSATIGAGNPFYPVSGGSTTITITCDDGVNTATDSVTINLTGTPPPPPPPPATTTPAVTLVANPTSVAPNATSTLTWTSTNTISCSAPWTAATSTSGTQIVTVATTTTYSIVCTDGTQTANAQATVTVVPVTPPTSCPVPTITSTLAVTTTVGQPFSYTITSSATTTPVFTVASSSLPIGLSFATSTATISGTPTVEGVYTIALTSTDPCGTDSKNFVLTVGPVAPVNTGGGGGGGGGGGVINGIGGHRQGVPVSTEPGSCLYLHDYMRIDFQNDPEQVTMLQIFLKDMQSYDYVNVNGVFDQATFTAVEAFQQKYASDILTPWGITAPTGYVYILTLKKINEIYCQTIYPLNEAQQNEITAYRALLQSLQNQGITPLLPGSTIGTSTPGTINLPIVGEVSPPKGQNFQNVAAAIFAGPPNLLAALQCFYQWLLILVIVYILGDIMKDVLYEDTVENVLNRFMTKWITISTALVLAIIIAIILKDWCLVLPLIIALAFSLIWMSLYPKHNSLRATGKSWYLVITARTKSLWSKKNPPVDTTDNKKKS